MKEVKTERVSYDIKWEAIDGTQFLDRDECAKYETTARMVLWAKFLKLVKSKSDEYSLFHVGSDEDDVYAVKMPTVEDKNTVMQLWTIDNDWAAQEEDLEWRDRAFGIIDKAYKDRDILLVGENGVREIYIIATRNSIFEILKNLDKEEPKDA